MAFDTLAPQVISMLSRDLKLSPQQAAGIVGQLGYESAGLQAINEQQPVVPGSRGGFGWAQWTGPRRRQFESWAQQNNIDVSSPEANYGYLVHELTNTPESRVLDSIRGAGDAQSAGRAFTDGFLRPGVPAYDKRESWTEKALNFIMPAAQAGTLPQEASGLSAKIQKAREAGYSDDEINAYLSGKPEFSAKIQRAKQAGYSDAEISEYLGMKQQAPTKPATQSFGETLMDIPRQVGLTARYGLEGLGQAAQIGTEPIRQAINPLLRMAGLPEASQTGAAMSTFADTVGLPTPQGANERVVGDAARLMAGAGGIASGANALARGATGLTQSALRGLATNPGQQAASAAGAGVTGGSVREAGGGPVAQAVAGLAGGLAAPMALSAGQRAASSIARRIPGVSTSPQKVEQQISLTMQRSGVDWKAVPERVRQQVRQEIRTALKGGDDLNADAVRRLADFKRIEGATPTRGTVTLDPVQITHEKNLAKSAANSTDKGLQGLARIENENNSALIRALNNQGAAGADDAYITGQRLIGAIEGRIDASKNDIGSLYQAARDTSGRSLPLNGAAFANKVIPAIDEAMVGGALPPAVRDHINKISLGEVPFTVEYAEQLKTAIGKLQRASNDGQTRMALGIVRGALDDTPLLSPQGGPVNPNQLLLGNETGRMGSGEEAIKAFNEARSAHRQMMQWIESSPAIKAIYEGKATPDNFVGKYIISAGSTSKDIQALSNAVRQDPTVADAVKSNIAAYLKDKALGGAADEVGNFSASRFNGAMKAIGDRKLAAFFSADEIEQLKAIGRVSNYMTVQPKGSAVNNSNSGALVLGRGLEMLDTISGKVPLLGIGPTIQGVIHGVQQGSAQRIAPSLLNIAPRLPMANRLAPAALYGGLLSGAPIPPSQDDRRP